MRFLFYIYFILAAGFASVLVESALLERDSTWGASVKLPSVLLITDYFLIVLGCDWLGTLSTF
jgi:hypothetical protein